MKERSNQGVWLMTITAVMWSIGGILLKYVPWNPIVICGYRGAISACVIGIYLLLSHRKFVFTRRSVSLALLISAVSLCFVGANKLTTAANAIVLQYTSPVFLLIFCAVFRQQRFRAMDYIAVALTLFGIVLFFLDQLAPGALLGNFLAVLSGVAFAAITFVNSEGDETERLNGIFQGHLLAGLIGIPLSFFVDTPFTSTAIISIIALGVFQLGIPYILFALAAKTCPPLTMSLLSAFEPILNPVWVFLFYGEAPGTMALVGAVIVILSVTGWCVLDAHKARIA